MKIEVENVEEGIKLHFKTETLQSKYIKYINV